MVRVTGVGGWAAGVVYSCVVPSDVWMEGGGGREELDGNPRNPNDFFIYLHMGSTC